MEKFTAAMVHDKDTITKLSVTQYNCFEFKSKLVRIVIAIALIVYGLYANQSMYTPMICLILGCILIANVNLRPRVRANKIIEQIGGRFPRSSYSFTDTGFSDGGEGKALPYSQLIKLVEDRRYIYLYVSSQSAYMVDKASIKGGTVAGVAAHLRHKGYHKTGRQFSGAAARLSFSPAFCNSELKGEPEMNDAYFEGSAALGSVPCAGI